MTCSRAMLLLLLAGCSGGGGDDTGGTDGVPNDNPVPVPEIWSHTDGEMVLEGWTVELGGTATDDGPVEELVGTWLVDGVEVCSGPFDAYDNSTCAWTVPSAAGASIRFEVTDVHGGTGATELSVVIKANELPTIEITAPTNGSTHPSGAPVTLTGRADDREDNPGLLDVRWESSVDGALAGVNTTLDPNGIFSGEATLSPGSHTLTATVEDRSGGTASASVSITVQP